MKAKYLHDVLEPRKNIIAEHRDELVQRPDGHWYWPAGTIEDHPKVFRLVQMGAAEPADEECERRHGRTPEQLARARRNYTAVRKGIAPEDYERFFAGELAGYNLDGSEIPGPNAVPEPYDGPLELPETYGGE